MMKYNVLFILLFATYFSGAQTTTERAVLASGGGSFSSVDLMVDHTIGEIMVSTQSAGNLSITQGFHQHYESPNAVSEQNLVKNFGLYPNPVHDKLTISFTADKKSNWKVQIMSQLGNEMTARELSFSAGEKKQLKVNCTNYAQGVYFVRLKSESAGQEYVYKFIKIK